MTRSAGFVAAFFAAAGSGVDREAEDVESVADVDSFFFAIHPLMKHTLIVWYHKTFADTMGPDGEWQKLKQTWVENELP